MFKHALCTVGEKANKEPGVIPFVLTKRIVDRDSEVIEPRGARIDNFIKNPVFLWAHGRDPSIPPIGKVLTETLKITKDAIKADVKFDLEDPFATAIYNKYKNGFLNAGSIRFMPITFKEEPVLEGQRRGTFTEWELLEYSAVTVPANPEALARALNDPADENYNFYKAMKDFAENDNFDNTPEGYVDWLNHLEELKDNKPVTGSISTPSTTLPPSYYNVHQINHDIPQFNYDFQIYEKKEELNIFEEYFGEFIRPNVPFKIYKAMDKDHEWNPEEALERIIKYSGTEQTRWLKFRSAFAWVDINDLENIDSYKFLHHDVIDGELVTVWRGVAMAMVELFKDKEVPENERKIIYKHLLRHYEQFEKEKDAPDFKVYESSELEKMESDILPVEENTISEDDVNRIIEHILKKDA